MKTDPRIYLAIDNCFASKRWTLPEDWTRLIRDMGIYNVEASADTECDPLYMGQQYTADWIEAVKRQREATGVRVKNVYSGHGTYATLGLAHTDARVRKRFLRDWMQRQADTAKALEAGFGFFAHAFDESVLQSAEETRRKTTELYDNLAELAVYCRDIGLSYVSVEQMYSPHQPPWTIDGAKALIREVYARGGAPMYITNDVGHMNGQQFFRMPDEAYIADCIAKRKAGERVKRVWMGSRKAMDIYYAACGGEISEQDACARILEDAHANTHLFAAPEDGNVYAWLKEIGPWAPIVHLQQSDGKSSPHWSFDDEHNKIGIITAEKVLTSIAEGYAQDEAAGMPEPCDEIVFTLEPFIGTAGNIYDALDDIQASARYWRRYIPRDGMRLSEAIRMIEMAKEEKASR